MKESKLDKLATVALDDIAFTEEMMMAHPLWSHPSLKDAPPEIKSYLVGERLRTDAGLKMVMDTALYMDSLDDADTEVKLEKLRKRGKFTRQIATIAIVEDGFLVKPQKTPQPPQPTQEDGGLSYYLRDFLGNPSLTVASYNASRYHAVYLASGAVAYSARGTDGVGLLYHATAHGSGISVKVALPGAILPNVPVPDGAGVGDLLYQDVAGGGALILSASLTTGQVKQVARIIKVDAQTDRATILVIDRPPFAYTA